MSYTNQQIAKQIASLLKGKQTPIFQKGTTASTGINKELSVRLTNGKVVRALAWNVSTPGQVTVFWDATNKRYVAWKEETSSLKRTTILANRKTRPDEKKYLWEYFIKVLQPSSIEGFDADVALDLTGYEPVGITNTGSGYLVIHNQGNQLKFKNESLSTTPTINWDTNENGDAPSFPDYFGGSYLLQSRFYSLLATITTDKFFIEGVTINYGVNDTSRGFYNRVGDYILEPFESLFYFNQSTLDNSSTISNLTRFTDIPTDGNNEIIVINKEYDNAETTPNKQKKGFSAITLTVNKPVIDLYNEGRRYVDENANLIDLRFFRGHVLLPYTYSAQQQYTNRVEYYYIDQQGFDVKNTSTRTTESLHNASATVTQYFKQFLSNGSIIDMGDIPDQSLESVALVTEKRGFWVSSYSKEVTATPVTKHYASNTHPDTYSHTSSGSKQLTIRHFFDYNFIGVQEDPFSFPNENGWASLDLTGQSTIPANYTMETRTFVGAETENTESKGTSPKYIGIDCSTYVYRQISTNISRYEQETFYYNSDNMLTPFFNDSPLVGFLGSYAIRDNDISYSTNNNSTTYLETAHCKIQNNVYNTSSFGLFCVTETIALQAGSAVLNLWDAYTYPDRYVYGVGVNIPNVVGQPCSIFIYDNNNVAEYSATVNDFNLDDFTITLTINSVTPVTTSEYHFWMDDYPGGSFVVIGNGHLVSLLSYWSNRNTNLYRVADDQGNEAVELAISQIPTTPTPEKLYVDIYRFNTTSLKWERRPNATSLVSPLTDTSSFVSYHPTPSNSRKKKKKPPRN